MVRCLTKNAKTTLRILVLYFGQRSQLWWDVPPDDSFYLLRDIYKVPKKEFEDTRERLIETLDLSQIVNVPTRQLSLRSENARGDCCVVITQAANIIFR